MAQGNRAPDKTFLIVTSCKGLLSQAGVSGTEAVFDRLHRISDSKREAGFDVHIFVPDSAERSTGDFPVTDGPLTARALRDGLGEVERMISAEGPLDYVLIVGDGNVIPFHYLDNPAADSDGEFPTDVPYAVADDGLPREDAGSQEYDADGDTADRFLVPDRILGRIPLAFGTDGDLLAYLDALASAAEVGPESDRHFGLSALQWEKESTRVYGLLAERGLRTSPPVDTSNFDPKWLEERALIYFNVHGSKDEKYWYGQEGLSYPRVLNPEIVAEAGPSGAIVLSEACYGGLVEGKTSADSVAMSFIGNGVSVFVGSSAIAYGSPDENLTEADLLAYLFFSRLVGGETAGAALREAKIDFAAEMLERQGFLDGDDRKTLLEFNLFGDPAVGIYKGRGLADRSGDMVSEEVLACIKKIASQRFPEMEGVEPVVSEHTGASGRAVAKKVGSMRPASAAKGAPVPRGRVFVASFRQIITVEGRDIERVVRITFHEGGEVLKVVTSK